MSSGSSIRAVTVVLLSPNGKAIAGNDVHLMKEADRVLQGWTGVLAGELYATVDAGRPRVFDLHTAWAVGPAPKRTDCDLLCSTSCEMAIWIVSHYHSMIGQSEFGIC